ncbi:MAG: hypothetical protein BIFFINMI_04015 [Phycisphaerae bacterium]|nr:hypothetical protein [Phycisphaerae bacterium]
MLGVGGATITVILFTAAVLMGLAAWCFFLLATRGGQMRNLNEVANRQLQLEDFETTDDYEKGSGGSNGRQ